MKRRRRQSDEAPGQDSFLDIVANLVGILIILVMVAGARAKDVLVEHEKSVRRKESNPPTTPAPVPVEEGPAVQELERARLAAAAVEADIQRIDAEMKQQQLETARRRAERNQLHLLMTAADHTLNQRRNQLDESQKREFDAQRELLAVRDELEKTQQAQKAVESTPGPVTKLAHLPTPMVKTVFGKELHFRLSGGRLAYVPWEEMLERFRSEAPQKIWKLRDAEAITETIGPLRDFRLKYTIRKKQYAVTTGRGTVFRERIEPDKLELFPVRDDLGEPISQAMSAGSQFDHMLRAEDPKHTTVTVWVYPDGFHQFRDLKQELYRRGFLTASRPMPEGHPIGASPQGARSTAQ